MLKIAATAIGAFLGIISLSMVFISLRHYSHTPVYANQEK